MEHARDSEPIGLIRELIAVGLVDGLTDGQLLERFLTQGGEVAELAFATLVARHGPMVLRVCRSILHDPHDAEDAFQATFLVLVQRARSIRKCESAASWLHGVACRTAARSRSTAARRRLHEQRAAERTSLSRIDEIPDDLAPVLNEELNRLPEQFRTAVILCELEGLTHERAAERLGWPLGTVRSRVARGRDRLRARLVRRGVAPALAACGALASARAGTAMPARLARATVRAAVRLATTGGLPAGTVPVTVVELTKGALIAMFTSSSKTAALCVLSIAVAAVGARSLIGQEGKDKTVAPPANKAGAPSDRPVTVEALEKRIGELERRLEKLLQAQSVDRLRREDQSARPANNDPSPTRKIRLRFASLVEKVLVSEGQAVKAGDALADLYSTDLIAAKNELLVKEAQWEHDRQLVEAREKLHKEGAISVQVIVDTRNDAEKSRLDRMLAGDKLRAYGLTNEQIKAVKDEDGEQKGRYTLRAPVAGVVSSIEAQPDDLLNAQDVILILRIRKP